MRLVITVRQLGRRTITVYDVIRDGIFHYTGDKTVDTVIV